jgi:hypothetical protein
LATRQARGKGEAIGWLRQRDSQRILDGALGASSARGARKSTGPNHSKQGNFMKMILGALLVATLSAYGTGAVAWAADAADPVVGTWTLNVQKSKFSSPAVKSQTRTYTQTAQGIALKVDGVAADGSPIAQQSTFRYDGKDYPFTGSPVFDTLSLKKLDAHTIKSTQKKAGKVVGTTIRTVSADGKMVTLINKGKDPTGTPFNDVLVFDRQ